MLQINDIFPPLSSGRRRAINENRSHGHKGSCIALKTGFSHYKNGFGLDAMFVVVAVSSRWNRVSTLKE